MDLREAATIALGRPDAQLGQTSKMPGRSFGLSAFQCKRGSDLAADPRTACGQCYARTNYYATKHEVVKAHRARMRGLRDPRWVEAMVVLVRQYVDPAVPYFRWHDSGDIQSVAHLRRIVMVCQATPDVRHWLPTHEPHMVRRYLAAHGAFPSNLCVRVSADFIDRPATGVPAGLVTSTIHRGHGNRNLGKVTAAGQRSIECKSYTRSKDGHSAGECGKCRACWDQRVRNVSFPLHGERKGKYQLRLLSD